MLDKLRHEFELQTNRSLSMPIAGAIIWAFVGLMSLKFDDSIAVFILVFATGAIFPIGLVIAKIRGEMLISSQNPLAKLMGLSVLMVNLLWGVHIPLIIMAPEFVPLSLGIGLGLHWIVYSWVIQHPLGITHAIVRTILIVIAWHLFPKMHISAVSAVIVFTYSVTIYQMVHRKIATVQLSNAPE